MDVLLDCSFCSLKCHIHSLDSEYWNHCLQLGLFSSLVPDQYGGWRPANRYQIINVVEVFSDIGKFDRAGKLFDAKDHISMQEGAKGTTNLHLRVHSDKPLGIC
jgi:hypothetical protein